MDTQNGNGAEPLAFLHLSDIHFKASEHGRVYDLDGDLRREIIRDAQSVIARMGKPHAILITGDIAYNGKPEQYLKGAEWVGELVEAIGCDLSEVWCVPGNHDVDWEVVSKRRILRDARHNLRSCEIGCVDAEIEEYLSDPDVFYAPLAAYTEFALQFGCQITVGRPLWEAELPLNDGSLLRVFGLNSVLISDANDGGGNLVMGRYQALIRQEDGVHNMILCHHPLSYLRDGDNVATILNPRAPIQLYGHEHAERMESERGYLRVSAGAIHPKRGASWDPRYNWIQILIEEGDESVGLRVEVFSRAWNENTQRFEAVCSTGVDGPLCSRVFAVDSAAIPRSCKDAAQSESAGETPQSDAGDEATTLVSQGGRTLNPARVLAQRYFSLDYVQHMEIADQLDLHENTDLGLCGTDLRLKHLERIRQRRQIKRLWDIVEKLHDDGRYPENPYTDTETKGVRRES
ncbi:hypothetical protein LCGC14_0993130 [marine sediment metagenome]|uniref:Calcineurin-like phosphoesterase domain-containing protein n=1 Tax=marine sediment metagenome TaxID=412755 RepID=A0A0F9QNL7_9ZZZZ